MAQSQLSETAVSEADVAKALRSIPAARAIFEVRMVLAKPIWNQQASQENEPSMYRVRRNDWATLSERLDEICSKAFWDERTVYAVRMLSSHSLVSSSQFQDRKTYPLDQGPFPELGSSFIHYSPRSVNAG